MLAAVLDPPQRALLELRLKVCAVAREVQDELLQRLLVRRIVGVVGEFCPVICRHKRPLLEVSVLIEVSDAGQIGCGERIAALEEAETHRLPLARDVQPPQQVERRDDR
eukprot:3857784-Prymnesium_polylepis.1